jgi:hypothetical protein
MPDSRVSRTIVSLARRRGRLPALVAALGIAVVLVAVRTVNLLISWAAYAAAYDAQPSSNGTLYEIETSIGFDFSQVVDYLPQALPFALGVFLGLWLIAPLADELTLPFVFTRGALATAAGAVLVIIAGLVIAIVVAVEDGAFDGASFVRDATLAAFTGASTFVNYLIPVLFASVLLWLWLRAHPRDYAVSGLIDEV